MAVRVKYEEVKHLFPWQAKQPDWLKEYEVLIKTKRRNRYYITKALSFSGSWRIQGFDKAKVIGRRDISTSLTFKT